MIGKYVDDGRGKFKGECVSLVKRLCPALQGRQKTSWRKGIAVKGKAIASGTAIASFDATGVPGHAAIFISQDAAGISVWDQYNPTRRSPGSPVGRHVLRFGNAKYPHYDGNNFFTIE